MFCVHYKRSAETLICDAFPDGIPEAILHSRTDHRRPVEGDHGIIFKQDPASGYDKEHFDQILEGAD